MTTNLRLLSESQSADLTGVGIDTIREYQKVGLLRPILSNNEVYFAESDLRRVFQMPPAEANGAMAQAEPATPFQVPEGSIAISLLQSPRTAKPSPVMQEPSADKVDTAIASAPLDNRPSPDMTLAPQPQQATGERLEQASSRPAEAIADTAARAAVTHAPSAVTFSEPGHSNSYDLLEVNKSLREQIEVLREERNWLRKRLEAAESRAERDQMLLLSETKTVRALCAPKRGIIGTLLLPFTKRS